MLVGSFIISAALFFICGLVALEVALLESRRAFIPQGRVQQTESAKSETGEDEGAVAVADFVIAARLVSVLLLALVGALFQYIFSADSAGAGYELQVMGHSSLIGLLLASLYGLVVALAVVSLVYLIPNFIGARFRDQTLLFLSPLGRGIVRLAWPVIATGRLIRRLAVTKERGIAVEEEAIEDDIRSLVKEGERAGVIEEEEREMISRVFRLGDKPIASLMTPRNDVVFLDLGMSVGQAVQTVIDSRLTWFPVRQGVDDEVVGIVSVHDVFQLQEQSGSNALAKLRETSSPALDVPESLTALELLEQFKEQGEHFAVVRDEYGSVAGIVTVYDVLQVVVGDMDEANGEDRSITVRDDGSLLVDASLDVQNLFETLGFEKSPESEQGQFHSVGGFVMTSLGHIPKPGDSFVRDSHRFEVVDMDGKRIDKILVARIADQRAVGS